MDGLILVQKPQKITSHDVVAKIRKILNQQKVGHFGTLDPMATGLILMAVGKATRLFPFYSTTDKVYKGRIRLGYSTDTYDSYGKPTSEPNKEYPGEKTILENMKLFKGEILQVPPLYSALKYEGKPLYVRARNQEKIKLKPRKLFIHDFRMISYEPPEIKFEVHCSSGTYIRSIAHDLGQKLHCGAHLSQLTRINSGKYWIEDSFFLEDIEKLVQEKKHKEFLIPLEGLLPEFPKIILKDSGVSVAKNGGRIFPTEITKITPSDSSSEIRAGEENICRMFSPEGKLIALARKITENNYFHPFLVVES